MNKHLQSVKKQRATGRTKDGATFPLSIAIWTEEDLKDPIFRSYLRGDSVGTCFLRLQVDFLGSYRYVIF